MKNRFTTSFVFIVIATVLLSCRPDEPELGDPPSSAEATFTYSPSDETNNIINFRSNASNGLVFWDFGNGTSARGRNVQGVFPIKGSYEVKSKVFTQGGSVTSTQVVNIIQDDFTLLQDSLLTWLTGGIDSVNGKTWVIDSNSTTHFGVGPNPPSSLGFTPEWYSAAPNEKSGTGLYNDRYRFKLIGFGFDMITQGDIYVHTDHQSNFTGAFQNKGDYTAPYPNQLGESWQLSFDAGADTTLTFSQGSWIGMNTQVSTYQIVSISENHMFLRQLHDGNDQLSWYHMLIPEGYVPNRGGGSGGTTGFALPFDFETIEPAFAAFGGSTVQVIDNPDARPGSINTSQRVLETVHGNETWAGIEVDLDSKLDFSTDSLLKIKVWAPTAGTMRVKLEDQDDSNIFIEKDIAVPVAFNWIEVSVGFADTSSSKYDKLVLFPGWNVANAGTFYLDDIKQDR